MFITQKELHRRIGAALSEARKKWDEELWRDRQIRNTQEETEKVRRELWERIDNLNERVYVLERKTGVINPPEPLKSCGHPCYQEAQAPAPQTGEART